MKKLLLYLAVTAVLIGIPARVLYRESINPAGNAEGVLTSGGMLYWTLVFLPLGLLVGLVVRKYRSDRRS